MLVLGCAARLHGGELPDAIARQMAQGQAKLQQLYTHATVEGTLHQQRPVAGQDIVQHFTYRAAGANMRVDLLMQSEQILATPIGSTATYMATPDYSLHAYRGPQSQAFDTATQETYAEAVARIERACPLVNSYSADGHATLAAMLQHTDVEISKIEPVTLHGRQMIKIHYRQNVTHDGRTKVWDAWLLLSPDESWAVREYLRTTGEGDDHVAQHGVISYDGTHEGVPLIHRLERWQEQGTHHELREHEVISVTNTKTESASHYYFTAPST